MLYRKAMERLKEWKAQPAKKALCVIGARQIGKTTLIREFARENYKYFAEINFVTDPEAKRIFDEALNSDTIITGLTAYLRQELTPRETLIFFDEIQECPNARAAIKFLVQDGRFDYIESGSMLGVRSRNVPSYPVGYEEIYRMYPMDIEEFFIANGVPDSTLKYLKDSFASLTPISEAVHSTLYKLFFTYIVVGGMPEAVNIYVNTHDIAKVVSFQKELLELYRLDITKYSDKDRKRICDIFDAIPSQLDDKNRRFKLSKLDKSARLLRYEDAFLWLNDAGVALPCYNVTEPKAPLRLNEKHSLFKLFMADTGLLCATSMENIQFAILKGDLSINMGSILENVIAQQLRSNGFELYYYDKAGYAKVDLLIQQGKDIIPIEIKSGADYKRHASLDKIMNVTEWGLKKAIVLCRDNIQKEGAVTYLPLYYSMFLKPEEMPEKLIYEPDLSGLDI